MEPSQPQTSPAVPIAIILGFTLIAIAIYFGSGRTSDNQDQVSQETVEVNQLTDKTIRTVDERDANYILGNPNAPILIIEYSDYDCPFCKRFHTVLSQVMEEYGVDGRVSWVYRQFPLVGLHPNAAQIAETALCVGHVGGRKAFWDFTNLVYNDRQATEFTNVTKIPQYIEKSGVSLQEHEACLVNEVMKEHLENEMADALDAGIEGTPYTFIMVGDEQAVINGAQSYQVVKSVVQNLIDQLDGEFDIDSASSSNVIPTNELGVPEIE